MERKPYGTDGVSKTRRIPYRTAKKLGKSHKINGNSTKSYEEAIQQEAKEPLRIKGQKQCMVGKQKYPFKQILKEAGPKKIWTF